MHGRTGPVAPRADELVGAAGAVAAATQRVVEAARTIRSDAKGLIPEHTCQLCAAVTILDAAEARHRELLAAGGGPGRG